MSITRDYSYDFTKKQGFKLCQKIIKLINLDKPNSYYYYVNKERKIIIGSSLALKICLTKEDFLDIQKGKIIDPDDSYDWIERNIVGKITLD